MGQTRMEKTMKSDLYLSKNIPFYIKCFKNPLWKVNPPGLVNLPDSISPTDYSSLVRPVFFKASMSLD